MAEKSVLGTVYETLLCSPGMNEAVKIDVKINGKTALLLNSVIDGSPTKDGEINHELLRLVPLGKSYPCIFRKNCKRERTTFAICGRFRAGCDVG